MKDNNCEEKNRRPLFTVIDINKILTLTKITDQSEEIARNILNQKFYFLPSLDVIDFANGLQWDYLHGKSNNTYQLYLHSLIVISYLCDAYRINPRVEYLTKANQIVESWMEYNSSDQWKSRLVWSDHAVADRLINTVYLFCTAIDKININIDNYLKLFESHASFLASDSNYSNNNHGIMMDRALFLVSLVLSSHDNQEQWREKAVFRLKEAFYRDFSSKGTHLENSPEYHSMVLRLYNSTETLLNNFGFTLGKNILDKKRLAISYFQYIAKPNFCLPIIGDSGEQKLGGLEKNYNNYVDFEAGIAVLQHEDILNPHDSLWLSFVCGFGSMTHKHFDDLSINLFYKGYDIFIDSGKYNYDYNDPVRKYLLSPYAHSTVTVSGNEYKLDNDKIKITDFYSTKLYDIVRGENNAYPQTNISRTIYLFKPDIILILDQVEGNLDQEILQIFNLSPRVEIKGHSKDCVDLYAGALPIRIIQRERSDMLEIFDGIVDAPRGIISVSFGKTTTTKQLQFSKKGKSLIFMTEIRMGEGLEKKLQSELDFENSLLTVNYLNRSFHFPT
jgi:hypothetical protein